jgi:hypothetical protein
VKFHIHSGVLTRLGIATWNIGAHDCSSLTDDARASLEASEAVADVQGKRSRIPVSTQRKSAQAMERKIAMSMTVDHEREELLAETSATPPQWRWVQIANKEGHALL